MIGNERFSKKTLTQPLVIKNPFYSTGFGRKPYNFSYRSPLVDPGLTNLEMREKYEAAMNAQPGEKDENGIDMSLFLKPGSIVMPSGVASVEAAEAADEAAHAIERFNAGILDSKQKEALKRMELAQKKQEELYKQKAIEYYALAEEEMQVPPELKEEVERWYNAGIPKEFIDPKDPKSLLKKGSEEYKKLSPEARELLEQLRPLESELFTRQSKKDYANSVRDMNRKKLLQRRANEIAELKAKLLTEYGDKIDSKTLDQMLLQGLDLKDKKAKKTAGERLLEMLNGMSGRGEFDMLGSKSLTPVRDPVVNNGWSALKLHELVRPMSTSFIIPPEQVIERQRQDFDDRENEYRALQTFQRGTAPPNEMVHRAVPKLAEPLRPNRLGVTRLRPDIDIIPHPFVVPTKKFRILGFNGKKRPSFF